MYYIQGPVEPTVHLVVGSGQDYSIHKSIHKSATKFNFQEQKQNVPLQRSDNGEANLNFGKRGKEKKNGQHLDRRYELTKLNSKFRFCEDQGRKPKHTPSMVVATLPRSDRKVYIDQENKMAGVSIK